jgi:NADP-dependent 3-hydroxy acid dehydrogenase YdfG
MGTGMGKVVLITGASSGFGEACAKKFAEQGYALILGARRLEKLEQLRSRLSNSNAPSVIEPGMAKTNFSNIRFKGDIEAASQVYAGAQPLTAADIADIIYWVTSVPAHVNINSLEVMPICQAWGPQAVSRDRGEDLVT